MAQKATNDLVTHRPILQLGVSPLSSQQEMITSREALPHRRREPHEPEDKGPPLDQIGQRTQEQQPARVARLRHGRNVRRLLVGDVKVVRQPVQDRVRVVQVRDGEAAGEPFLQGISEWLAWILL